MAKGRQIGRYGMDKSYLRIRHKDFYVRVSISSTHDKDDEMDFLDCCIYVHDADNKKEAIARAWEYIRMLATEYYLEPCEPEVERLRVVDDGPQLSS